MKSASVVLLVVFVGSVPAAGSAQGWHRFGAITNEFAGSPGAGRPDPYGASGSRAGAWTVWQPRSAEGTASASTRSTARAHRGPSAVPDYTGYYTDHRNWFR